MVSPGADGRGTNYSLFYRPAKDIAPNYYVSLFTSAESVKASSEQLGPFATELALKLLGLGATHVGVRNDKVFVWKEKDNSVSDEIDKCILEALEPLYSNYRMPVRVVRRTDKWLHEEVVKKEYLEKK